LADRFSGQIALDLALIGSEVRQREEHSSDEPAPDVVAIVPVEGSGDGVKLSGSARQLYCIEEGNISGEHADRDDKSGDQG